MIHPEERVGNGTVRTVQYSLQDGLHRTRVRGGLYRGDLCVGLTREHRGRIFIPYWANTLVHAAREQGIIGVFDPELLIHQVFTSVYHARRYTYHLLEEQYGVTFVHGEKARIIRAKQALEELNLTAIGLRTGNAAQLAKTFRDRAGFIIQEIGPTPRNDLKRQAVNYVVNLGTVVDRLGRVNASAKMAISVAAMNRLKGRMVDIRCIEPKILARRQTIETLIEEMEVYLEGIMNFISLLMQMSNLEAFFRDNVSLRSTVRGQLGFYIQHIELFDIAPFDQTSRYIAEEFGEARELIGKGSYGHAVTLLMRSWNSLKLRKIRTEIEHAILEITFLLFGKPVSVNLTKSRTISESLIDIHDRLLDVDERGFRQRVVEDAANKVLVAQQLISAGSVDEVKAGKDALKAAADLL
ncbi:MAG: hypothetical protein UY52_C0018G0006 [Parcubacteria group bacterium GW2011_GWC2_49_9]|nr:MAG: hypothetical protein UY34_C0006G0021 [Parcubacteria group bacterium GW2011_GWA2_48_9]KKW15536.1 MAG: hypothetical protein UY52_C0018G0006 [Parcubacteria group bacterium GW2011_GWC2_49_9]